MKARDNPFATGRIERLLRFDPELVGTCWDTIEARWRELDRRACVVGHHGSGKTTFLDAFARRLEARQPVVRLFFNRSHHRLDDHDRELLAASAGAVVLVDGDGHLPWRERRELARTTGNAAGLLSARHRARGLPVLLHLRADLDLARRLAARLVDREPPDLERRLRRRRLNLRELWMDCYDDAGADSAPTPGP